MSLVTKFTFLPQSGQNLHHITKKTNKRTSDSSSHALLLEEWGAKIRVLCRQHSTVTDPKQWPMCIVSIPLYFALIYDLSLFSLCSVCVYVYVFVCARARAHVCVYVYVYIYLC